jgi:hypothetical protein
LKGFEESLYLSMRIFLYVLFLFLAIPLAKCQAQLNNEDVQVILNQQALNKLFTALGPVYGSDQYSILFVKGTYHWTLQNPHIELSDNCADYEAEVAVESGPFSYTSKINGDVSIVYSPDSNKIIIRITRAMLPLYTTLFGKRVHIKDINLAESYKTPFVFDGPLSLTSDIDFSMPDGNTRRVHALPVNCTVIVTYQRIIVPCGIEFVTVSIKK